tara:strand:- start:42 stop:656 length:615 start_codon:yes stop_codon:yes gene_type:complete
MNNSQILQQMDKQMQYGGYKPSPVDNKMHLRECAQIIDDHQIDIDEDRILDLLAIKYRWPEQSMNVLNQSGVVSTGFFDKNNYIIYDMWKDLYDYGFTTLLRNVLDLTSQLRELNKKLLPLRGSDTIANFYLSKGTDTRRPSYDPHSHDYHVVVKPIYGRSTWVINGEQQEAKPGSVVIVPAFSQHSVTVNAEPRLSLTLNLTG